jgi:hypothetical protein
MLLTDWPRRSPRANSTTRTPPYPYIEWYADNGRVVLELGPDQIEVIDIQGPILRSENAAAELEEDEKRRAKAFGDFMSDTVQDLSEENRRLGGDGNVSGFVVE